MCARVEGAIRLQGAGVHDGVGRRVFHFEFHPTLVEVALLRNIAMADALVLNHDRSREQIARCYLEGLASQRRDELIPIAHDPEDIHIEDVVAQKGKGLLQLLIVSVILGNDGVGAEPAVRGEFAIRGSVVRQLDLFGRHVAGLAGGDLVFDVERKG